MFDDVIVMQIRLIIIIIINLTEQMRWLGPLTKQQRPLLWSDLDSFGVFFFSLSYSNTYYLRVILMPYQINVFVIHVHNVISINV